MLLESRHENRIEIRLETLEKFHKMLSEKDIERFIYNTVDIVPYGEDSVFLGVFSIWDNPACMQAILEHVTNYYDTLLRSLPLTITLRLQLQMQRCFTYGEYTKLFSRSIPENQFHQYPIFRTLLIGSNAQRLLFIRNHQYYDESYEGFVECLRQWSKFHNPFLHSYLYEIHDKRTSF